jgi:hypothetical protein
MRISTGPQQLGLRPPTTTLKVMRVESPAPDARTHRLQHPVLARRTRGRGAYRERERSQRSGCAVQASVKPECAGRTSP